jgi:hypothetical protein
MLETYKATLHGDHIVWQDDVPDAVVNAESVEVIVTVMETNGKKRRRPFGLAKGDFVVPDDFDDPLPEEVLREFEGR